MDGRMNGYVDKWKDEGMVGGMDGWMVPTCRTVWRMSYNRRSHEAVGAYMA